MSDDGHITVDFAKLRDVSIELEDILRQLNGRLQTLYDKVEPIVLAWEGQTREIFVDKLDEWDHSAQDLQAAQTRLHAIVTHGQANYSSAQQAVLRGWGAQ
ncbi:WXG100 family type VII secretion target [Streptomyces luteolus]|uniref:WXG100 family type VII secretion target n=1 Tax=Streptomyces luteolus TaxID=3043615 RepID=A0ABT6SQN8_9ACTN|nr:WXG100 family type VII secretion target [Streptomyces sp. B-S-A12]MDI3417933.1 WXG100 family type VII secretion target [Streptomyces sp. B-S-A12]